MGVYYTRTAVIGEKDCPLFLWMQASLAYEFVPKTFGALDQAAFCIYFKHTAIAAMSKFYSPGEAKACALTRFITLITLKQKLHFILVPLARIECKSIAVQGASVRSVAFSLESTADKNLLSC